jgi:hypothetical protein
MESGVGRVFPALLRGPLALFVPDCVMRAELRHACRIASCVPDCVMRAGLRHFYIAGTGFSRDAFAPCEVAKEHRS